MALDKDGLKNALLNIVVANLNKNPNATEQDKAAALEDAEEYVNSQVSAIEEFVKTGDVTFAESKVTGTCPSVGGPLTLGAATEGTIE